MNRHLAITRKQCKICKEQLPLSDFNRNRHNPDGLEHQCRECKKEYLKQYRRSLCSSEGYVAKLTEEEYQPRYRNGYVEVRCGFCNKYFTPTNQEVSVKIKVLKGQCAGNTRFYCSTECKNMSPFYSRNGKAIAQQAINGEATARYLSVPAEDVQPNLTKREAKSLQKQIQLTKETIVDFQGSIDKLTGLTDQMVIKDVIEADHYSLADPVLIGVDADNEETNTDLGWIEGDWKVEDEGQGRNYYREAYTID